MNEPLFIQTENICRELEETSNKNSNKKKLPIGDWELE